MKTCRGPDGASSGRRLRHRGFGIKARYWHLQRGISGNIKHIAKYCSRRGPAHAEVAVLTLVSLWREAQPFLGTPASAWWQVKYSASARRCLYSRRKAQPRSAQAGFSNEMKCFGGGVALK